MALLVAIASRQLAGSAGFDGDKMVVWASVGSDVRWGGSTGARGGAGSISVVEMVGSVLVGASGDIAGVAVDPVCSDG